MKKIVQRTKRFEKSYIKLQKKVRQLFLKKMMFFLDDEFHLSLDTHRLKGKMNDKWAFSITGDIRAVYTKEERKKETVIVFTFIDIGGHNRVY